jgi:hypothetical protein
MGIVGRSGEGAEEERDERAVAASGDPELHAMLDDWDPSDPDTVKVHYDLGAWSLDDRAALAEACAERSLPHAWEGDELVVPEAAEAAADALFDELEALGVGTSAAAAPVALAEGMPATEYGLDEWPAGDRATLTAALIDAEIPFRWEGTTVVVAADAEAEVDDLLDAIERGELVLVDEDGDGEPGDAPEGVMGRLFSAADRLAEDPDDTTGRIEVLELDDAISAGRPPFGVGAGVWERVVAANAAIAELLGSDEPDGADLIDAARQLRTLTKPFA